MNVLRSRDNARVKRWAKLVRDGKFRRQQGRALLEGPHLLSSLLEHGLRPLAILATEQGLQDPEIATLIARAELEPVLLAEAVFRAIVDSQTPQGLAAEIALPDRSTAAGGTTVFLEGIQDAGNVGTIIRSAAAFGAAAVVLDAACADPWSPKTLRAGMGGHFAIPIVQVGALAAALDAFTGKLLCTVAHGGTNLRSAQLSGPIGWLFGSEGSGVSRALQERAAVRVTIPAAPGTESLNVAAAAAICLYEGFSRPGAGS
jgi:RNA methyltransferase, TrmH family